MTLIALHLIQNHAPSNLNRDDNGDPKDAFFGGVRRARISSQALKRTIRHSEVFTEYFVGLDVAATRSKLPTLVEAYLKESGKIGQIGPDGLKKILIQTSKIGKAGKSTADSNDDSDAPIEPETMEKSQLMFLTNPEVKALADGLVELLPKRFTRKGKKDKKETEIAFDALTGDELRAELGTFAEQHSVDIAMFGRMTTSSPFKDIEASVQVAHALSTHRIEQEFDFFTAVDDRSTEPGAGLLGETAFNSATYYKYFNIHWEGLVGNLHGDKALALKTVQALIHAAMVTIPSGKQNSFAAHNVADWALIEVRPQNVALSYANAFLKPVRPTAQSSLLAESVTAISEYIAKIDRMYALPVDRAMISTLDTAFDGARLFAALSDALAWLSPLNS
ncbi:MAG: type I-E CRISPR-associated protein Cas7/Cse4/CasC [Aggregatilineales bacterium]